MITPFQIYGEAICKDLRGEKLRRALIPRTFDGTEIAGVIDRALPGLENATAVETIKTAIESKYSNSIPINIAVELILALLETGGEPE
jgi:hypothetical protein